VAGVHIDVSSGLAHSTNHDLTLLPSPQTIMLISFRNSL
jgi:hypothetical protein